MSGNGGAGAKEPHDSGAITKEFNAATGYLVRTSRMELALEYIARAVPEKTRKIILTRQPPEKLTARFSLPNSRILWLTQNQRDDDCLSPWALPRISTIFSQFLEVKEPGMIILGGVEYLATQNEFDSILRLVQFLNDKIMLSRSCLLVLLDPGAFSPQQNRLLEGELEVCEAQILTSTRG